MSRQKEVFQNVLEVLEYLQDEGWKISKTSIYQHVKDVKLRPEPDGTFTLKRVRSYAQAHLQLKATRQKQEDEDLQRRKLWGDIELLEERLKRERLKRETEEGRLMPREDVDLELASRAVVQDHEWTRAIQSRAGEIVSLVEGNVDRTPDLIRFLMEIKDEILNEFASARDWHVLFQGEES